MPSFKLGHSANTDWSAALDDCLAQCGDVHDATLGFVYISDHFAEVLGELLRSLRERSGVTHWVGSLGQGILATGAEYEDTPAISLLLTDFPTERFHLFDWPEHPLPPAPADSGLRLAVVHGDPRNGRLPELIARLPEELGHGYLVGGITSSSQHYYQIANGVVEGGLSGVILEEPEVVTGLTQGVSPLGPVRTLTDVDQHMAITIDGRPALDVFKEDIGEVLARDIDRAAGYIFAGFPVAGSDTGDYLVRNIIGIDPENGLLAIGDHLQAGRPIMFCRRDGKSAREDMDRMLADVQSRLKGRTPRGGLYFSCLGRGRHLFGESGQEMAILRDALGDVPLTGFYAAGEIAGQRLYGYTGVLTLFL